MSGDSALSVTLLGFVLGLQHATDPDHLVAVGTIVTGERRFRDGALIGTLWGLGHTATLAVAGGILWALNVTLQPEVGRGLELLVAAAIVTLGALRLRDALRGFADSPRDHVLADHDHDGGEAFHSHTHTHGRGAHAHPHVHPSPPLLNAVRGKRRQGALRAFVIGAVHGLAGTAALSLLVLTTLPSASSLVAYLLIFGLGTIAGMTVLTAALAYPVVWATRFYRAHRALGICAGLAAIAFGLGYAWRVGL